jgi:hypothetical protein
VNSTSVVKSLSLALLATMVVGCSDKEDETKNSSDFATSAIEAHYVVEISEANKVIYQANFVHDKDSLELEGGDVISIETNSEKIALGETISSGTATYYLSRTETQLASRYFFEFTRSTQVDADGSYVKVPDGFNLVSPTDGVVGYVPSDGGESFTISWRELDTTVPVADEDEEFTLRYNFTCRNDSGTPSIESSYAEKVADDGSHVVNLANILGAGDYDECSKFNIIAVRSDSKGGVLDSAIKSGSTIGFQIRTVEGSLDGLQLL